MKSMNIKLILILLTSLLAFSACKVSRYNFVKPGDDSGTNQNFDDGQEKEQFTFDADPDQAEEGQKVTFTADCRPKSKVDRIEWDFGDEEQAEGEVVTHVFQTRGTYKVTAICYLDNGKQQKSSIDYKVVEEGSSSGGGIGGGGGVGQNECSVGQSDCSPGQNDDYPNQNGDSPGQN